MGKHTKYTFLFNGTNVKILNKICIGEIGLMRKKTKMIYIIYGILVMLMMYVFYTSFKPIMVCDPDDWTYISYIRKPLPLWKNWNPAKILPETVEGLLGYFAAYVVFPICGDYIYSFTYTFAAFISFCIAAYVISSAMLLKKLIPEIKDTICIVSASLLFLVNFIFLRGNNFFFTASNLNCFLNYLFPSLFCMVLINYMLSSRFIAIDRNQSYPVLKDEKMADDVSAVFKEGTVLLLIYLAVFSNMVCNVIFVIPMVLVYFYFATKSLKNKSLKDFLLSYNQSGVFHYTFILEIICLFYEYNGGRANSFSISLKESLVLTIEDIKYIWHITDKKIFITCLTLIILSIFINIKKEKFKNKKVLQIILWYIVAFGIIAVYLTALYTQIGDHKLQRCENIFVFYILFVEAAFVALGYLLNKYTKTMLLAPILLFILIAIVAYGDYKPSMSYYYGDRNLCYDVNSSIVRQFEEAEKKENYEFELHVPKSGLGSYDFSGDRIAATLYKHGITASLLKPHLVLEEYTYFTD